MKKCIVVGSGQKLGRRNGKQRMISGGVHGTLHEMQIIQYKLYTKGNQLPLKDFKKKSYSIERDFGITVPRGE